MSNKLKRTLVIGSLVALTLPSIASAEAVVTNASLTVREAVALTNVASLNFGVLDAPTDLTTTYTLTSAGVPTATGGNGTFISGSAAGNITVAGENGQTVDLSIATGACTVVGITLASMEATYEGSAFNNTTANTAVVNSGAAMGVGGAVSIDVGTATGAATCAYTVTVAYQ